MRSRGYGLPGRSSYTAFRMDGFNAALLVVLVALGGLTLVSLALGAGVTRYFPGIALASGRWLWDGRRGRVPAHGGAGGFELQEKIKTARRNGSDGLRFHQNASILVKKAAVCMHSLRWEVRHL